MSLRVWLAHVFDRLTVAGTIGGWILDKLEINPGTFFFWLWGDAPSCARGSCEWCDRWAQ